MAVYEIASKTFHWQLQTSDPRPNSGVTEGSTCHYVDTGEVYIYHNGMWVEDLRLQYALKSVT